MEPVLVTERPERTVSIRLALEDVVITESRYATGERGPDLHVHQLHTDSFYILAGTFTLSLGGTGEEFRAELAARFDQHPPPADGGLDPASVIVRTAGTDAVGLAGTHIGFLANADEALGTIGLVEYTAPPFFPGPPLHVHDHTWDAY